MAVASASAKEIADRAEQGCNYPCFFSVLALNFRYLFAKWVFFIISPIPHKALQWWGQGVERASRLQDEDESYPLEK